MNLAQVLLAISTVLVAARAFEAKVETQAIFDRWRNLTQQEHPECLKTWPITEGETDEYFRLHKLSNTPTFKCYLECINKAFNLINEDGSVNRDKSFKMFERLTYQMIDLCEGGVVEKTDNCERAYEFVDCVIRYKHVYD